MSLKRRTDHACERLSLWIGLMCLLIVFPASTRAEDGEKIAMARVFLTTDAKRTEHCAFVATVSDDSLKDLRRKIVRAGGDTGLLSFASDDLSVIFARVYRCPVLPPPPPPPPPPSR